MLGKLARWLRMLGHDVEYYRNTDDKKLIDLALSEGRILLTRDFTLYQRAKKHGSQTFFITTTNDVENLAILSKQFGFCLNINLRLSRCPKCNGTLVTVSKEDIITKIPKATSICYEDFWLCKICGKIYWRGAHWKRIKSTLEEAKFILQDGRSA